MSRDGWTFYDNVAVLTITVRETDQGVNMTVVTRMAGRASAQLLTTTADSGWVKCPSTGRLEEAIFAAVR